MTDREILDKTLSESSLGIAYVFSRCSSGVDPSETLILNFGGAVVDAPTGEVLVHPVEISIRRIGDIKSENNNLIMNLWE